MCKYIGDRARTRSDTKSLLAIGRLCCFTDVVLADKKSSSLGEPEGVIVNIVHPDSNKHGTDEKRITSPKLCFIRLQMKKQAARSLWKSDI